MPFEPRNPLTLLHLLGVNKISPTLGCVSCPASSHSPCAATHQELAGEGDADEEAHRDFWRVPYALKRETTQLGSPPLRLTQKDLSVFCCKRDLSGVCGKRDCPLV